LAGVVRDGAVIDWLLDSDPARFPAVGRRAALPLTSRWHIWPPGGRFDGRGELV
jgi:hypothetical protein